MTILAHISRTYRGKQYGPPLVYKNKNKNYQVNLEKFES